MDTNHDLPILLDSDHIKYLKAKYPRQSKRVKWLEDEHVAHLAIGFEKRYETQSASPT